MLPLSLRPKPWLAHPKARLGSYLGKQTPTHKRKPLLSFVFVGSLSLRFADRVLDALLFHDPPRNAREPAYSRPVPSSAAGCATARIISYFSAEKA